jgi:hypothetical protein
VQALKTIRWTLDQLAALAPVLRAIGLVDSPPILEWGCLLNRTQHLELESLPAELPRCLSGLIAPLKLFISLHIFKLRATRIPSTTQPPTILAPAWTACSTTHSIRLSSHRTVADQTS